MTSLLLLALVLIQRPGALQPGAGIVTGSIQVAGGGSPAGVRVAAVPADDPSATNFLSIAETDASGRYRLSNIPQGRYYIVAGRVNNLSYYPGGSDRSQASEVVVESAKVTANVNFTVPAESKRPVAQPPNPFSNSSQGAVEWNAYRPITTEKDPAKKLNLLLNFEKNFPKSKLLPDVYTALMEIYVANHNDAKASEYGAKALKQDPQNVAALVLMSRKYALLQNDFTNALQYAERAVAAVTKMKNQPPPTSEIAAWQNWVASLDSSARGNLVWVRSLQSAQERLLLSNVTRRR